MYQSITLSRGREETEEGGPWCPSQAAAQHITPSSPMGTSRFEREMRRGSDRERKKKRRGEEKGIHNFEPCNWSYSFAMAHGRW